MGEKSQFPVQKNSNNLCRYSTFREVMHGNALSIPEVFTAHSNLIPKTTMWKVGESNLAVEKPDKQYLSQVVKVSTHSDVMLTSYSLDTM